MLTWSIDFEQKSRCVFRHQVAFFRQKRGETKQTKLLKQQFFCVSGPERVPPLFFVVAASFRWGYFIYEFFSGVTSTRCRPWSDWSSEARVAPEKKLSDELLVSSTTTTTVFGSSRGGGCRSRWQRPIGKRERGAVAGVEGRHLEREREEGKNEIHLKHRR